MTNRLIKTTLFALSIALVAFTYQAGSIRIKGSDTVLPLAQKEAELYMKANTAFKIAVTGGGSGVGISALLDGTTDIAMSSRSMKIDEKLKMQDAGKPFKEVKVAYDALSVIVNTGNTVSQLTRQQLEDIFTGKITNWSKVGGADLKIIVYSRESSSGTYEFFKEKVLMKKNYAATVLSMSNTGGIVQSVSQTKGAIGYVGLAYLDPKVKALGVSFDGKTFVKPSMATAKAKTYPVTRPLFYYYLTKNEAKVKPFVDYMLSATGQKTVEAEGYVPLK